MTHTFLLPSGISTEMAKKDAKKLKKQNPNLSHTEALNIVCKNNGFGLGWNRFMAESQKRPVFAGSKCPYRNILIRAINHLLENNMISLVSPKDYYERQMDLNAVKDGGYTFTAFDGRNTVISWHDAGHEELRISVWWDYDHSQHPQANLEGNYQESFRGSSPLAKRSKYKNFVGVTCSGWLERKKSKHLQGHGKGNLFQIYTRTSNLEPLKNMKTVNPIGYKAEGKFYM